MWMTPSSGSTDQGSWEVSFAISIVSLRTSSYHYGGRKRWPVPGHWYSLEDLMAMPGHSINSWHHNQLHNTSIFFRKSIYMDWVMWEVTGLHPKTWFLAWLTLWHLRWEQYIPLKCQAFSKQHSRNVLFTVTCNINISLAWGMLMDKRKNNILCFLVYTQWQIYINIWPHIEFQFWNGHVFYILH
jgi:hypothetical protein